MLAPSIFPAIVPEDWRDFIRHIELDALVLFRITDSTSILRIQFEEFSFSYRIDFEVATYNNGVINKQMPHYTPVVTDLGLQGEPEVLENICRNDSVFARRVLRHAVHTIAIRASYIPKWPFDPVVETQNFERA